MPTTILIEGSRAQVLARCVALLEEMGAQDIVVHASEDIITARLVGGQRARDGPVALRLTPVDDTAQQVEVDGQGAVKVAVKVMEALKKNNRL